MPDIVSEDIHTDHERQVGNSMKHKIVLDSSGNLHAFSGVDFASVPLKIIAGDREFTDSPDADVKEMVQYLRTYKGRTTTACPGVGDFLEAFGDAENVYCVTITSNLSGAYNAARLAADTYLEKHPDRKVYVFDSLSTAGEMALLAEKLRDLIREKLAFDKIVEQVKAYQQKTRLMFSLESLHNLAANGRVPAAVAAVSGILGIRLIGKASDVGTLQPTGKARGEKKLIPELVRHLKEMGYNGGKVRIDHCDNLNAASTLKQQLLSLFPAADIAIGVAGALCSFYAEQGGLLIGFEVA